MEDTYTIKQNVEVYNQTFLNLLWDNKIKLILFTIFTMIGYFNIPRLHKIQDDLRRKQLHNHQYLSESEISERKEIFEQFIDVRSSEEYKKGHLTNSIQIDYKDVMKSKGDALFVEKKINPKKTILIYCKSGRRASLVATHMIKNLNYPKKNIYITNTSYKDLEKIFYPQES